MASFSCFFCFHLMIIISTFLGGHHLIQGQQEFLANKQLSCYNNDSTTWGYVCNGPRACSSYLVFRSQPPYNSVRTISSLLNANRSHISQVNGILPGVTTIPTDTQVIVPVNCSCSAAGLYQHNATYTMGANVDSYQYLSNDTYQGLTTCQGMMNQNPYDSLNLSAGLQLLAPLRCACPTRNQTESGVRFLLTYIITWGDTISALARRFEVDQDSLLEANKLSLTSTIFPFNPLLVPLTKEPTREMVAAADPPPPPSSSSSEPPQVPPSSTKSQRIHWVAVGIGVGAAACLLLLLIAAGALFWFIRSKHRRGRGEPPAVGPVRPRPEQWNDYVGLPSKQSGSLSRQEVIEAMDSLTVYKFEELKKATGGFIEDTRIQGSVYRGVINGHNAAIKIVGGNVTNEINALKRISHSSVIRLSGFCVHQGCTYLVYEFAEQGSVHDWLHGKKHDTSDCLSWRQRVQIAYDVADGLTYLHNYASPPYIHKDLRSSNVLLDGNFRAKLANFGLARTIGNEGGDAFQLTQNVVGTQGYLAPEYLEHGLITPKLDVYAYGVLLLELLSGREALSSFGGNKEDKLLSQSIKHVVAGDNVRQKLQEFVDPCIPADHYPLDMAFTMAELAHTCIDPDVNQRPSMGEVFLSVSKIHSTSMDWDFSEEPSSSSLVHAR